MEQETTQGAAIHNAFGHAGCNGKTESSKFHLPVAAPQEAQSRRLIAAASYMTRVVEPEKSALY